MNITDLQNRLHATERYFSGTRYHDMVTQASESFYAEDYSALEEVLGKFPTSEQLLNKLVPILKGKSVYATLRKVIEGKNESDWTSLKGLSSLCTHCIIECERGNREYLMLVHMLYERIGQMLMTVKNFDKSHVEIISQGV